MKTNNVDDMIKEIRTGFNALRDFIDVAKKMRMYLKTDGIYDSEGIRRYKFYDDEYSERCLTETVHELRERTIYVGTNLIKFPKKKNGPIIISNQ